MRDSLSPCINLSLRLRLILILSLSITLSLIFILSLSLSASVGRSVDLATNRPARCIDAELRKLPHATQPATSSSVTYNKPTHSPNYAGDGGNTYPNKPLAELDEAFLFSLLPTTTTLTTNHMGLNRWCCRWGLGVGVLSLGFYRWILTVGVLPLDSYRWGFTVGVLPLAFYRWSLAVGVLPLAPCLLASCRWDLVIGGAKQTEKQRLQRRVGHVIRFFFLRIYFVDAQRIGMALLLLQLVSVIG